jgi:hypothetical protein
MSIERSFINAIQRMKERKWEQIYVWFDIHGTIFKPDYGVGKVFDYYPKAKETLQYLSTIKEISLGLYTCSYPEDIAKYMDVFENDKIDFQHINVNTKEKNTNYACFDQKPYFNVLIDDKAGFFPEQDWFTLYEFLIWDFKIFLKK